MPTGISLVNFAPCHAIFINHEPKGPNLCHMGQKGSGDLGMTVAATTSSTTARGPLPRVAGARLDLASFARCSSRSCGVSAVPVTPYFAFYSS